MPTSRTPRLEPRALLRERLIDAVAISADGETVAYSERTVVDGVDQAFAEQGAGLEPGSA